MRRDSPEERAGRFTFERSFGQQSCRKKGRDSKACQRERVFRKMQHRLQKLGGEFFPIAHERSHQSAIIPCISTYSFRCFIDTAGKTRRGAIVERMSERNLRLNPGETKSLEGKRFEKW